MKTIMKNQPTKELVLDALQTHKTISAATKALGIKHPEMMRLLKQYDIKPISARDLPPVQCEPLFEQKIEHPVDAPLKVKKSKRLISAVLKWFNCKTPVCCCSIEGPAEIIGSRRIEEANKELMRLALKECEGNKKLAAERLGISMRTLNRKIKEYNIKL